jgi:hypothetical protein
MPASPPRIVATIERLHDLAPVLRRYILDELKTTFSAIDDVSGLPDRYTAKLLSANPIKGIGRRRRVADARERVGVGGDQMQLVPVFLNLSHADYAA